MLINDHRACCSSSRPLSTCCSARDEAREAGERGTPAEKRRAESDGRDGCNFCERLLARRAPRWLSTVAGRRRSPRPQLTPLSATGQGGSQRGFAETKAIAAAGLAAAHAAPTYAQGSGKGQGKG